jgi:small subunit ribosomal protein S8
MTMTDSIADMLTRVRNANVAMHDSVKMPGSKLKEALAAILEQEGYIAGFRVSAEQGPPFSVLEIDLKYAADRRRAIAGLRRVSKPGLRVYARSDKLPRVLGGMGIAVLSTSRGLMTDRDARKNKLGGEVLCYVW